jgi:hypothetical protein
LERLAWRAPASPKETCAAVRPVPTEAYTHAYTRARICTRTHTHTHTHTRTHAHAPTELHHPTTPLSPRSNHPYERKPFHRKMRHAPVRSRDAPLRPQGPQRAHSAAAPCIAAARVAAFCTRGVWLQ